MITKVIKKVVGSRNDRILRRYGKVVKQINALEPSIQALSDAELRSKTDQFRAAVAKGATLASLLPEAFAVVREASFRALGMRHYDVQLLGGMIANDNKIVEMRTGEGKTLMSTLACYLNALTGKGVHVVTVNDYLAERDANWMRPVYDFLGMTVGVNLSNMSHEEKQAAYAADITYGTNNEFGFDYLRDNMVYEASMRVQRELHYAIIDEVDSILIDEARTPLIISGQAEHAQEDYKVVSALIPKLVHQKMGEDEKEEDLPEEALGDYTTDEKTRQAHLTERGHEKVEALLVEVGLMKEGDSLYDLNHLSLMHFVGACLRAHALYQRDVHYVVKNNEVMIVDEHTGRLMDGRRWSDGLHQAVEAKENVPIQLENQTLASITFQNYFRLYEKIAGMTGTADTEAFEFQSIYGLEVVVAPTNRPTVRKDEADLVFLTKRAKYKAAIADIKARYEKGQPQLVGTASIEASEELSSLLKKEKIPHEVLNAKQHEREAHIIAQAGRPKAVTIATNMAGRGTDIVLGGNVEEEIAALELPSDEQIAELREDWKKRHEDVLQAGGLHVLGTERHESRRIDNQLRGRSGRQGDPGSSQFYLSMDDHLMRIFASEKMHAMLQRFGFTEEDVIENRMITNLIEKAQRRVEGHNFDVRKNLLEYDDVANDQRQIVYEQRSQVIALEDPSNTLLGLRETVAHDLVGRYIPEGTSEDSWDVPELMRCLREDFHVDLPITEWLKEETQLETAVIEERIVDALTQAYLDKIKPVDPDYCRNMERHVMLQSLDKHWKEHLSAMDHLRKGIDLRGYAQKNPAQEYKRESFELFQSMLLQFKVAVVAILSRLEAPKEPVTIEGPSISMAYNHGASASQDELQTAGEGAQKVGRNAPCPCGSGKKYKQCHGKLTAVQ